jgi:hypothetical protein
MLHEMLHQKSYILYFINLQSRIENGLFRVRLFLIEVVSQSCSAEPSQRICYESEGLTSGLKFSLALHTYWKLILLDTV